MPVGSALTRRFYWHGAKYEKLKTRGPGDRNPFVDPEGYKAHVDQYEKSFEAARLAHGKHQAAGKGK